MPSPLFQLFKNTDTDEAAAARAETVTFSLISHTNVGKTTLARTLLRQDVGDALDQSHVTDVAEVYTMLETDGRRLLLWDTPGFGDTARLLKRLKTSGQPVAWMIAQLWDRFRDRPLWCSQQAVRNVQEEADVVLYLVNAAERPDTARYVEMEMEILAWIGKPVVVLLNQTGPPKAALEEDLDEAEWRKHVERWSVVKAVISLDAFARCWVQEHALLDLVAPLLPDAKRVTYKVLREEWRRKNLKTFHDSVKVLAEQLCASAADSEPVTREGFLQKLGVGRAELNAEMERARAKLSKRLSARAQESMNALIRLHELEGQAAELQGQASENAFGVPQRVDESLWTAVGGAVSGATLGILADIKAGGMTLGGGALAGMLLGGAGSYLLARGFNLTRGENNSVRWTEEHFAAQVEMALLCYLAVAHYGRGRGEWRESEHPDLWRRMVSETAEEHRKAIGALWKRAGEKDATLEDLHRRALPLFTECAAVLLQKLYPAMNLEWLKRR